MISAVDSSIASAWTPGLVSVVMPCYNAEPFLADAVLSAMEQSYPQIELLVVDDGSTDRSLEILQGLKAEFGERLSVFSQRNRGAYVARNLGLKQAAGEFVAFLDSDDYWDPQFVAKQVTLLQQTGSDLVYCGWQNVGTPSVSSRPYLPPRYESGDTIRYFLEACPWPIHAALLRREVVDLLGGFSERRFSSMDYDFWLRTLTVTSSLVQLPEVLAFYRWHGAGQISDVKWRQVIDAWHVRRDFVRSHPELVAHLDSEILRQLVDGFLLQNAYTAFWKRDLASARRLFRTALCNGCFQSKDLRHILTSLLPEPLYRFVVRALEQP